MPRYGDDYVKKPATEWAGLPESKRLWFVRHLSTGAGPDGWRRHKKNVFQRELDAWWGGDLGDYRDVNSPVYIHDWDFFRGFKNGEEVRKSNWRFFLGSLGRTPWAFLVCYGAYVAIEMLGEPEFLAKRRDEDSLDFLISEAARRKEKNEPIDINNLMTALREHESKASG